MIKIRKCDKLLSYTALILHQFKADAIESAV